MNANYEQAQKGGDVEMTEQCQQIQELTSPEQSDVPSRGNSNRCLTCKYYVSSGNPTPPQSGLCRMIWISDGTTVSINRRKKPLDAKDALLCYLAPRVNDNFGCVYYEEVKQGASE